MKALGDYCGGVPPLPFPNREVKTASADGTAIQCGRVGHRHSLINSIPLLGWSFFCALKALVYTIFSEFEFVLLIL